MLPYTIIARAKVAQYLTPDDIDRLALAAITAAERSPGWAPGEQFLYEIEEDKYVSKGTDFSAFTVEHGEANYELHFYYGVMAETIGEGPQSWEL